MKRSGFIPGRKLREGQVVWVVETHTVAPQSVVSDVYRATIERIRPLKDKDSGKYAIQYAWFYPKDYKLNRRSVNYKVFALRHFTLPESSTAFFKTKKEAVAFMKALALAHRQCIPMLWARNPAAAIGLVNPKISQMLEKKFSRSGFLITEEAKATVRKRYAILKEDENGNVVPTEEGRALMQSLLDGQGGA